MKVSAPVAWRQYRLFGLSLRSVIELPDLEEGEPGGKPDVEIRLGDVPQTAHPLTQTPSGAILTVAGVGRFLIADGRRITVDALPEASSRNVRLFLLGTVMGLLLHQRGLLPLHANAVEIDGRAAAFLGQSGAGKSSLAAAFHDRGRRILSDDVCVVTREGATFTVQAGPPRLRLWRDALERSGRTPAAYEPASDTADKYTVGTDAAARAGPTPLGAIYLLRRGEPESDVDVRPLSGMLAARALIENTYRGGAIRAVGDPAAHFEACLALSRAAPVFELIRPWSADRIGETMTWVEAHFAALAHEGALPGLRSDHAEQRWPPR